MPVHSSTASRPQAETLLRALAGDDATLRSDQWTAIEALVADRRRALVVQRTGWGKSAVYFVATGLLRDAGAGPTVIISPLLALMRNQIAAAERAGIHAATINSTNTEQWHETYDAVRRGDIDVLLLSPERLTTRISGTTCSRSWPPPAGSWSSTRRTASATGGMTSVPTSGGCAPC
jgi:ATP-dependent DNA helicase RecQ